MRELLKKTDSKYFVFWLFAMQVIDTVNERGETIKGVSFLFRRKRFMTILYCKSGWLNAAGYKIYFKIEKRTLFTRHFVIAIKRGSY